MAPFNLDPLFQNSQEYVWKIELSYSSLVAVCGLVVFLIVIVSAGCVCYQWCGSKRGYTPVKVGYETDTEGVELNAVCAVSE